MVNVCWSKLFHLFHNPLKKGGCGKDITNVIADLTLANVEALASSNEYEPGNDCSGCIMNSLYICKLFGDWGGCIGDPYVHHA